VPATSRGRSLNPTGQTQDPASTKAGHRHPRSRDTVSGGTNPVAVRSPVGGLTRYAAGNDTVLIRTAQGEQNTYSVHLNNLIRDGDIDSNVALRPGDILIIPQRLF
jgi:hypothetical protein